MVSSGKHFEAFADHTLLKHAILYAYLQRWAFKILQWGGAGDTAFFVDGFAGAGRDRAGNAGSPVIACRISQQVRARFRETRPGRDVKLKVIAVESAPATLALLKEQLAPFERIDPHCVRTFFGDVSGHMQSIVSETGPLPTLFFLDPFGIGGLDARTYPQMLAGAHNEILALFHDIGAVRLRGVVHSGAALEQQLLALKESPSLFPEIDAQVAKGIVEQVAKKRRAAEPYAPAARSSISRALGDTTWEEELRNVPADEARIELIFRFVRRLVASGAAFVHVLPMRGESGGHKYCLIHASKALKGFAAMKDAVSESLNKEDLSAKMRSLMRDDLRVSEGEIVGYLQRNLGGRTLKWTSNDRQEITVRRALLEGTAVFSFQAAEIRNALRQRGWLRRVDRIDVCAIPPPR
jgi:three-Cys-motif partner protein